MAATTSSVYPTVVGAPERSRPKADLGDGTAGWHFDVTLHNLSGAEATYELSSQALSEIVEGGFFTGKSADWRGKGVDIAYSGAAVSGTGEGATITVPANGEATVGVDVKPGADFDASVAQNTPNGTFLDGFVRFTSKTASQPDLTVPYLGFYGNWGKAPIFDALASEDGAHTLASWVYNGTTGQQLGYNPLVKDADRIGLPNPSKNVISRSDASGAPTVLEPRTGTLRSVHTINAAYTNAAGEKVASFTRFMNWKSGVDPSTGKMTWLEQGHDPMSLDARADAYKNLPDGAYKLTLSAHNDGPSQAEQSISYEFRLDTAAPVVSNLEYKGEGADTVLSFDITDASLLAAIDRRGHRAPVPAGRGLRPQPLRGPDPEPAQRQYRHRRPVRKHRGRSLDEGRGRLVLHLCRRYELPEEWLVHDQRFGLPVRPVGLHGDRLPQARRWPVGLRERVRRPRGWLDPRRRFLVLPRPGHEGHGHRLGRRRRLVVLPHGLRCDGHRMGERWRLLVLPERLRPDGHRMAQRERLLVLPVSLRRHVDGHPGH